MPRPLLPTRPVNGCIFITCSDANTVAAVDISQPLSRILGFIPTGWYPTGATALPDGTLAILNGKGKGSFSNIHGPNPLLRPEQAYKGSPVTEYVGHIQTGTASFLPEPDNDQLHAFTQTVVRNSPYKDEMISAPFSTSNRPTSRAPKVTIRPSST